MMKYIVIFVFFWPHLLFAQNRGVMGEVYPIQEKDLLQFIEEKLHAMQNTGDLQRVEQKMVAAARLKVDRPTAVQGMTRTTVNRSWDLDPSVRLSHDLKDQRGRIFAAAGTLFNPLSLIALREVLIFYNADDPDQAAWAKQQHEQYKKMGVRDKLILVNGSVLKQAKQCHQTVYFDQGGRLTQRFHIKHVPAWVAKEGLRLRVSEVAP